MKKLCLLAAIAVFCVSNVNAQDVKFGAKAGVNFASIGGDETEDLSGLTSFHVGVVAEISLSEKFAVQPELLYSRQGATLDNDGDVDINLDYINVPVMLKYGVSNEFNVEFGPQVGFLTTAEVDGEDFKEMISGIDFGVNIGLSYEMESGLNFGARYNLGLSDINDFEDSDGIKNQNNVFQVSVGYFFN